MDLAARFRAEDTHPHGPTREVMREVVTLGADLALACEPDRPGYPALRDALDALLDYDETKDSSARVLYDAAAIASAVETMLVVTSAEAMRVIDGPTGTPVRAFDGAAAAVCADCGNAYATYAVRDHHRTHDCSGPLG